MAEIVNLRQARKAKARAEAEKKAEANRIAFGTPKAEKMRLKAEKALADRRIDGGRLETAQKGVPPRQGEPTSAWATSSANTPVRDPSR